jgi:hypothetical protein
MTSPVSRAGASGPQAGAAFFEAGAFQKYADAPLKGLALFDFAPPCREKIKELFYAADAVLTKARIALDRLHVQPAQDDDAWKNAQRWFANGPGGTLADLPWDAFVAVRGNVRQMQEKLRNNVVVVHSSLDAGWAGSVCVKSRKDDRARSVAPGLLGRIAEQGIDFPYLYFDIKPLFWDEAHTPRPKDQVDVLFHECTHSCLGYYWHKGTRDKWGGAEGDANYWRYRTEGGSLSHLDEADLLTNPDTYGGFLVRWY